MKIALHVTAADVRECTLPYPDAEHVVPAGACPHCQASPFHVSGGAPVVQGHDTQTAPAWTRCCGTPAGKLVVTVSTLFGIEEDERVCHGRCRVY
jgi:hypothetical protein